MTPPEAVDAAGPADPAGAVPVCASDPVRPPSLPVLAPLLPLILLVGLGIAGMTDPPAPVPGSTGQAVSRLHLPPSISKPDPSTPDPSMPDLARHDLPGHGQAGTPR
jgi:hypothetical protein